MGGKGLSGGGMGELVLSPVIAFLAAISRPDS